MMNVSFFLRAELQKQTSEPVQRIISAKEVFAGSCLD